MDASSNEYKYIENMTLPLPLAAACHLPLWFGCVAMVLVDSINPSSCGSLMTRLVWEQPCSCSSLKDHRRINEVRRMWLGEQIPNVPGSSSVLSQPALHLVRYNDRKTPWKKEMVFFQICIVSHIIGCFTVWAEGVKGGWGVEVDQLLMLP